MRSQQKNIARLTHVLYLGQDNQILTDITSCLTDATDIALTHETHLETVLTKDQEFFAPVILLDFSTPNRENIRRLRRRFPDRQIILLADDAMVSTAVQIAEENDLDYIAKSQLNAEILRRAVRYGRNQQRLRTELALINQIGHHLISTLDLNQVQATALEEVRSLLDVMSCSLWLFDTETGDLVCQQVAGPGRDHIRGWRLKPGQGIVGWVAQHSEPLLIHDTWNDPRHYGRIDQTTGLPIRSTLCLPLQTKQKSLGALQLVDKEIGSFTHSDLLLLEPVATATAIAIENAQLYQQAQQEIAERKRAEKALLSRNLELDRLYRASDSLLASTTPDIKNMAQSIVQTVQKEFAKANCSLVLIDTETNRLNRVAALGPYAAAVSQSRLSLDGSGLIAEAVRTGHTFNTGDVQNEPGYVPGWQLARSELTVPLKIDERVIGAIDVQSADVDAFNQDDERLLSHFADRAALALQSARLFNETQRWAKELDLINHVVATITAGTTRAEIFQTACIELSHFLEVPYAFISMLDEDGRFQTIVTENLPLQTPTQVGQRLPVIGQELFETVLETGSPYVSAHFDLHLDTALAALRPALTAVTEPVSLLVAPIVSRGQVAVGSLILVLPGGVFAANAVRLVKVVGEELGRAQETLRLSEQLKAHAAELEERVATRTEDLHVANTRLVQALQSRDEFLASMSHELRTPLNAILLRCELMNEMGNPTPEQARSLAIIEESAQHLLELINDILDVAKIEAGKLDLILERVDVRAVCISSLQMVRHMAERKQIQVVEGFDDTAVILSADGRRLKQILVNLLSNAVKFTPEGGMVGLEVLTDPKQSLLHFVVWDNGIGIAEDDMPNLFKPFVQLDSSLARKYSGTGLGLALVQRLVKMHQGTVSLESTVGLGSRFTVSLPWVPAKGLAAVAKDEEGNTAVSYPAASSPALSPSEATILLAEDNEITIEVLGEFLASQGYEVVLARNGLEAVELARQEKPDFILMDIQMPGMDGLEAIRRIRAEQPQGRAPVIVAVTALVMPGDQERCLNAGANAYISKPISFKDLNRIIKSHLGTLS